MEKEDLDRIKKLQDTKERRQRLVGYCKKIAQGIENLDERSEERAFWELIQNARDMAENCLIKIQLCPDKLIFSHHGKPFDYISLLALVTQNSSKDDPEVDQVGRYGTGFMTTHKFNDIVTVDGPYQIEDESGYVEIGGLTLNRSFCNNATLDAAVNKMEIEIGEVENMFTKEPIYRELPNKWTSFTYELSLENLPIISNHLTNVIKYLPFVLTINERIKDVEIFDQYRNTHFHIKKLSSRQVGTVQNHSDWQLVSNDIIYTHNNGNEDHAIVKCLRNESDIIILPPYPKQSGKAIQIPSLFLSFPLLGTEDFGVNFIFHSSRFHPVEKRDNILLPCDVASKKDRGEANEKVLKEMMSVLFDYYRDPTNCLDLTREFCYVNFKSEGKDDATIAFYKSLQNLWKENVISWEVIPTDEGRMPITDSRVRVLDKEFYSSLNDEQKKTYEPILEHFAKKIQRIEDKFYLIPNTELIAWSETVNQWLNKENEEEIKKEQSNQPDFFISVSDVCESINEKSDKLKTFLAFLNDSGNSGFLDTYKLLPNREGILKKKGDLCHGDFMTSSMYDLTKGLMGSDVDKMIDTEYNTITTVASYSGDDLQKAITQTISQWRNKVLGTSKEVFTDEDLNTLIAFCSATSQDNFTTYRGKMIRQIVKIFDKEFKQIKLPCPVPNEEEFYYSAFNFLMDYTLYTISLKDSIWVESNIDKLTNFLSTYAESKADERLSKLKTYGVIPNCNFELCLLNNLSKNIDIDDKLEKLYKDVIKEDLKDSWVHSNFSELFTYAEQKAQDVANSIQNKLSEDDYKNPIVLDIIEFTEDNEKGDYWAGLFKSIHAQKEAIRYRLGTDEERKAINRMMKKKNPDLLTLMADVVEREDASKLLHEAIDQANIDSYNKRLGDFVEHHIQNYIEDGLKGLGVTVTNQQKGQDIVISKDGYKDYHVEVKSRWNSGDSVEMTKEQLECAVQIPDSYALIRVNMYRFNRERALNDDTLSLDEIYDNILVLDNIGELESDIKRRADEAFESSETDIRLSGKYKVRVPQQIFKERKLEFNQFIEDLRTRFSATPWGQHPGTN